MIRALLEQSRDMSRSLIQKRRQSRFLLIQAIYQWQLSENPIADILLQTQLNPEFQKADQVYFSENLIAIAEQALLIDKLYQSYLDRDLEDLGPIEKSILRLATYEFAQRLDIPYRVIINEALELAKIFAATDSYKYINGVLDKVAKQLRAIEIQG